jgi:hypothetical protein
MREFSVTSGTVFRSRKLSLKKLLMAIWEDVTAVKSMAALHPTRKLGVEYKTAWVLLAKIREAIGKRRAKMKPWGSVQIDGKYIGAHIKPENKKEDRIDRRRKENQNGKRMCVLSIREHNPDAPNRTITRVVSDENPKAAWAAARDHVQPRSLLTASRTRCGPKTRRSRSSATCGERGGSALTAALPKRPMAIVTSERLIQSERDFGRARGGAESAGMHLGPKWARNR